MKKIVHCMIVCILMGMSGHVLAEKKANYCGELKNHYGPFDYRLPGPGGWSLVEDAHFTPEVEAGLHGMTGPIGGDIDYTLRAIPNHPRALETMGRLSLRAKTMQMANAHYPTECYFERAVRFTPNDAVVRGLYGNYLTALGRHAEAIRMFESAVNLAPDNPAINYNLGLVYMRTKNYDKAAEYADKAYALGFPLPGLRNQLAQVRKGAADSK